MGKDRIQAKDLEEKTVGKIDLSKVDLETAAAASRQVNQVLDKGRRIHCHFMGLIANSVKDQEELALIGRMIDTLVGSVALQTALDTAVGRFNIVVDGAMYFGAIKDKLEHIPEHLGGLAA